MWQDFLRLQGASITDGVVQHFSHPTSELVAVRDGNIVCDLSQFGTLKIHGEEAQHFLQSLLSSDISEVNEQHAQISSLSTPKGLMLATFLVWRNHGDYLLHLPSSLCATVLKRLTQYILRAKVKIDDVTAQQIILGVSGKDTAQLMQQIFGSVPPELFAVQQLGHAGIIRVDANRFLICLSEQLAPSVWTQLSAVARPVGSYCWDWLNIRAGFPVILPATQEQFVAQMANLELIGGVSFKKGCYPGQEIVARMQYLGKLKRRMYLVHIDGKTAPQPADELFSSDMEGQPSGMVVNATAAPDGGWDMLAVVQISSRETATVHHLSLQGAVLQFMALPYLA